MTLSALKLTPKTPSEGATPGPCVHCGNPIPPGCGLEDYCCTGCQWVHRLISDAGLDRFHELKSERLRPLVNHFSRAREYAWVEDPDALLKVSVGEEIRLDVEGVQCAACIWLIQSLAKRQGFVVHVNSALGRLTVTRGEDLSRLRRFLETLDRFGYRTAPHSPGRAGRGKRTLLMQLGAAMAIAMNGMMLSIAFYVGLTERDSRLFELFRHGNFVLGSLSFFLCGSYFLGRAWQALTSRILHLDLPIALGMVLTYLGSTYAYWRGDIEHMYFDTLMAFIALMLLGRFLQGRLVERNRSSLLTDLPLKDFRVLKVSTSLEEIRFADVKSGDRLLIQPGSFLPVDARLISTQDANFRLDWCSGEMDAEAFQKGDLIPAGGKLLSLESVEVCAESDFAKGDIGSRVLSSQASTTPKLWQSVARVYVLAVLGLAFGGALFWALGSGWIKGIEVGIAVAVVTCPCGLGIALPLARSLASQRLLQMGVFQRDEHLLEKLTSVRKVLLDKTGTLTLSDLSLSNPQVLEGLSQEALTVLFNASAKSLHPVSRAIFQRLRSLNLPALDLRVIESVGEGLKIHATGHVYRLGKGPEPSPSSVKGKRVVFSRDDVTLAVLTLEETLMDGAKATMAKLLARGLRVCQISGDRTARVVDMGKMLGLRPEDVFGDMSPSDKGALVAKLDARDTLYLGDGLNDVQAFQEAFLTGAPVWDHSMLAETSAFHFQTRDIAWLDRIFDLAKLLSDVIRFNLMFALSYNILAVGLALAGVLSPLACAILMPLSSLTVVSATAQYFRKKLT